MANGLKTFDPDKPYEYTGKSVSQRVQDIIGGGGGLMRQARTQGLQEANRRGLLNSSIAAGAAQEAVTRAAVPIASQESAEENQRFLGSQGVASTEKIAGMNIRASLQEKAGAAATALEGVYSQSFGSILDNPDLSKTAREQYLGHIGRIRDSSLNLVEQLYGIQLNWETPTTPTPVEAEASAEADAAKKAKKEKARAAAAKTGPTGTTNPLYPT